MEKDFIPYQEALELKQLGFDEECFRFKNNISNVYEEKGWFNWNQSELFVSIPLYQQAFRFFREKYELFFWIEKFHKNETYIFQIPPANFTKIQGHYTTYEEAELACLRKLIEIVKQKQP
jgi:hypothetical protein